MARQIYLTAALTFAVAVLFPFTFRQNEKAVIGVHGFEKTLIEKQTLIDRDRQFETRITSGSADDYLVVTVCGQLSIPISGVITVTGICKEFAAGSFDLKYRIVFERGYFDRHRLAALCSDYVDRAFAANNGI